MYNLLQITKKYIKYYITAANGKGHGVHPPFIYDFITTVLNGKPNPTIEKVKALKKQLLIDTTTIEVADFGAGSATKATNTRSIQSIAKHAAKPHKYATALHNIAKKYQCKNIVELGTSLGISSAYMALANTGATLLTCEGSPAIAAKAKSNFEKLNLKNIILHVGEFSKSYSSALQQIENIDLLFIDGNHQYQATIDYFNQAKNKLHNDSIIVFDDIHWSQGMEKAWAEIKAMPIVSETIDLFFLGIVFVRKEQKVTQHFTIRY